MARDRFATRAAILESAEQIIARGGVPSLGLNALARAAGCDKVLIYRYFGGLEGVLEALGAERMLWPAVGGEGGAASLADALRDLVLEEWAALRDDPLMREAALSECTSQQSLAGAGRTQRREHHAKQVATLEKAYRLPPFVDLPALVELLSAALTLLALRAVHTTPDPGAAFDPATPQGWRRIEKTVGAITRAMLAAER
jgi:AcrR family transcriptional regulator